MIKKLLVGLLCIFSLSAVEAQKKSELIAEISELNKKLDSTENLVLEANRKQKASEAQATSLETQVTDLQDANATLLKNLNSFAEVSNKNSAAVNQALASLEQKENQLKVVTNAISSNDSTAIVLLTNAKQTLGEDAKLKVANGSLIVTSTLTALFTKDTEAEVAETALPWLEKVAAILKSNPDAALTIEGLSMTGNLDLAARQATALMSVLRENYEIDANRMSGRGKDGNFKEGIDFKIHPKFENFYLMVKEEMKN